MTTIRRNQHHLSLSSAKLSIEKEEEELSDLEEGDTIRKEGHRQLRSILYKEDTRSRFINFVNDQKRKFRFYAL